MQRDLFDTPEAEELREEAHDDDYAWWDDYSDDDDERYDEDDGYDDEEEDDTPKTYSDYIVSLEDHAPHSDEDDALTRQEWRDWIHYEAQLHDETIDDDDVERIVRTLEDDGYVRRTQYDD